MKGKRSVLGLMLLGLLSLNGCMLLMGGMGEDMPHMPMMGMDGGEGEQSSDDAHE